MVRLTRQLDRATRERRRVRGRPGLVVRPPRAHTIAGNRSGGLLAHTDVIVLGAGIVGTSIAVHLAKRGLSVALIDRAGPGEGTSYGNAGIIEGNTVFPPGFPSDCAELVRIAFKRSPVANYHLSHLPRIVPWLAPFAPRRGPRG